jgi:GGDEF domain-containing protein
MRRMAFPTLKGVPQKTDKDRMGDPVVTELARVCERRFSSLGDAVQSVLTMLESQIPGGRVVFGELNYDTDEYRVLDARGDGAEFLGAGLRLPLGESFCMHMAHEQAPALIGRASKHALYRRLQLHKLGGVESYVAAPIELGDGTRVASVCAMSTERDSFGQSELDVLTIAARLLAYEWECVTREGELRRLTQQRRAERGDALTGLPLREAFLDQLDREWHLTQRGITDSYVLALKPMGIDDARATSGDAVADLLLQSTSEVILADVRRSDIAGRVDRDVFGVILVGCKGIEGADAFLSRLARSFERKLSHRPERLELVWGVERLGDADSAAVALERAERALDEEGAVELAAG